MLDRTKTWSIVQVRSRPKKILNYHDQMNQVLFVTKTRHENDVTDHTCAIYTKNDTKISWSIRLGANYDENQIG